MKFFSNRRKVKKILLKVSMNSIHWISFFPIKLFTKCTNALRHHVRSTSKPILSYEIAIVHSHSPINKICSWNIQFSLWISTMQPRHEKSSTNEPQVLQSIYRCTLQNFLLVVHKFLKNKGPEKWRSKRWDNMSLFCAIEFKFWWVFPFQQLATLCYLFQKIFQIQSTQLTIYYLVYISMPFQCIWSKWLPRANHKWFDVVFMESIWLSSYTTISGYRYLHAWKTCEQ